MNDAVKTPPKRNGNHYSKKVIMEVRLIILIRLLPYSGTPPAQSLTKKIYLRKDFKKGVCLFTWMYILCRALNPKM